MGPEVWRRDFRASPQKVSGKTEEAGRQTLQMGVQQGG